MKRLSIAVFTLGFFAFGCKGPTEPDRVNSVRVIPDSVSLEPSDTFQFRAEVVHVTGNTSKEVGWSVTCQTGTAEINENGLFTAPEEETTCTVRATSTADPTKSAIATVTVVKMDKIVFWRMYSDQTRYCGNSDNICEDLFIMNADGSNVFQLTSSQLQDATPAWSHDGKKIAFYHGGDIAVINANGSGFVQLTRGTDTNSNPAWSPDDKKIAFFSTRGGNQVWVMNADGSDATQLTSEPPSNCLLTPSWSPDGKKIVFGSCRNGNFEIYTVNVDGTELARLTTNSAGDALPKFSPDGKTIVFTSDRDGNFEIYKMNIDGGKVVRLTNNSALRYSGFYPTWSPDGKKIAYMSGDGAVNWEIFVMNADGTNQVNITKSPDTHEGYPAWRP